MYDKKELLHDRSIYPAKALYVHIDKPDKISGKTAYCGFGAPTGHTPAHAPQSTQTSALISK